MQYNINLKKGEAEKIVKLYETKKINKNRH